MKEKKKAKDILLMDSQFNLQRKENHPGRIYLIGLPSLYRHSVYFRETKKLSQLKQLGTSWTKTSMLGAVTAIRLPQVNSFRTSCWGEQFLHVLMVK